MRGVAGALSALLFLSTAYNAHVLAQYTLYTACYDCVGVFGQGWCIVDNACEQVIEGVAVTGRCSTRNGTLILDVAECQGHNYSNPCIGHTTCTACAQDPKCGWSSNNYVCQQGDSAASYGPGTPSSAKDGTWLFHSDACPSRCDEAKDCWACSQLEDCGWCMGSDTYPLEGAHCVASSMASECAAHASSTTDCGITCVAAEVTTSDASACLGIPGCGLTGGAFCNSGTPYGRINQDLQRDSTAAASAPAWTWGDTPCSGHGTECDCVADASCGWCDSTSTCLSVSAQRLCDDSWHPPCVSYNGSQPCTDCTQAPGGCCGFCGFTDAFASHCVGGKYTDSCYDPVEPGATCPLCLDIIGKCDCLTSDYGCSGYCGSIEVCLPESDWTCSGTILRPCAEANSCEACLATECCGFCDSTDSHACLANHGERPQQCIATELWLTHLAQCSTCEANTDPHDCLAQAECGWCQSSQQCGSTNSSVHSRCADGNWYGPCSARTTCSDCVGNEQVPGCAFCVVEPGSREQACMTVADASNAQMCSASVTTACGAVSQCDRYNSTCACTGDPLCGWCPEFDDGQGRCLPTSMHFLCPTAFSFPCSGRSTYCGGCLGGEASPCCSWCAAKPRDQACGQFNASHSSCPYGLVTSTDQCSPIDQCDFTDQCTCMNTDGCGWCSASSTCLPKEFEHDCDLATTACGSYSDCSACVTSPCCQYCVEEEVCDLIGDTCSGNGITVRNGQPDLCAPATQCAAHTSVCACVGDDGCSWCDEACIPIDQSCDGVAYPPCSQFFSCDSCTLADAECCGYCFDGVTSSGCQASSSAAACSAGYFPPGDSSCDYVPPTPSDDDDPFEPGGIGFIVLMVAAGCIVIAVCVCCFCVCRKANAPNNGGGDGVPQAPAAAPNQPDILGFDAQGVQPAQAAEAPLHMAREAPYRPVAPSIERVVGYPAQPPAGVRAPLLPHAAVQGGYGARTARHSMDEELPPA